MDKETGGGYGTSWRCGVDREQIRIKLRELVRVSGSQAKVAAQLGISVAYLGEVLRGTRNPGRKILTALGLRKEVQYSDGKVSDVQTTNRS